jgi:transposase InsO family protein
LQISELLHGISDAQVFDLYYSPRELEVRVGEWVEYYSNHRSHEAIDNVTPSDKYFGRLKEILEHRKKTKN